MMRKNIVCETATMLVVVGMLGIVGCSRQPIEDEMPVAPKKSTGTTKTTPPAVKPGVTTQPGATPVPPAVKQAAANASSLAELEAGYASRSDVGGKMEMITKITDVGGSSAVTAMGRLFQMEKDPAIRVEILSSLYDIDEQDEAKVGLLSVAVNSAQPQEVREEAISALEDVEPKLALPILRSLSNDSNEDIRDAAKDAIELLEAISKGTK